MGEWNRGHSAGAQAFGLAESGLSLLSERITESPKFSRSAARHPTDCGSSLRCASTDVAEPTALAAEPLARKPLPLNAFAAAAAGPAAPAVSSGR